MIEDQLEGLRIEREEVHLAQPSDFTRAARTLVTAERPPVQAFIPPKSFEDAKKALLERLEARETQESPRSVERTSAAYADLGGGTGPIELPNRQLLLEKTLLLSHESWHTEIDDAVERFGLAEISADELKGIPIERDSTVARQLYAFIEKIKTIARLLDESNCDTRPGYCDRQISDRFKDRSQVEMQAYFKVLTQLLHDIHDEGIDQVLNAKLGIHRDMHRRRIVLAEAKTEQHRHTGKQVQLGKDSRAQVRVRWQPVAKV